MWCPESGVKFDCINSYSLPPFLLGLSETFCHRSGYANNKMSVNTLIFSYPLVLTYVLGA